MSSRKRMNLKEATAFAEALLEDHTVEATASGTTHIFAKTQHVQLGKLIIGTAEDAEVDIPIYLRVAKNAEEIFTIKCARELSAHVFTQTEGYDGLVEACTQAAILATDEPPTDYLARIRHDNNHSVYSDEADENLQELESAAAHMKNTAAAVMLAEQKLKSAEAAHKAAIAAMINAKKIQVSGS